MSKPIEVTVYTTVRLEPKVFEGLTADDVIDSYAFRAEVLNASYDTKCELERQLGEKLREVLVQPDSK
jgi:hypothetical protein